MGEMVGIVLGAGSSERLGRPKQTLPFGDTTLLGWVMREVEASSLDRVVLVVGGAAEVSLAGVHLSRSEVVHNDAHREGCASSLLAGLDAAGPSTTAMLLLGDMPGVDAAIIDAVRGGFVTARPWAAVTSYRGEPGHPFVFSAAAFPTLRTLHGDKAVWKLLDGLPHAVYRVEVDRPLPRDVDTWEDVEAVRTQLGFPPTPGGRAHEGLPPDHAHGATAVGP
ncbi:MAG: nucleotidyltransferase family protein [Actinobacteria bacterium]|nr:nucleotidyltransferase family protein [Actinomycetota bacterium]